MRPHEAAALLRMHPNTIRTWTLSEYKRYFSPTAQGGSGRTRNLTDLDVRVLSYINTLKKTGTPPEEIHQTLQQLQEDDWQDLPELPPVGSTLATVPVVPQASVEALLRVDRDRYEERLAILNDRIQELKDALDAQVEVSKKEMQQERDKYSNVIDKLKHELTETKLLLRLVQEGKLRPDQLELNND